MEISSSHRSAFSGWPCHVPRSRRTSASLRSYGGKSRRQTARRKAFNRALEWAGKGWAVASRLLFLRLQRGNKKPRLAGLNEERMMGLEPTTFCMASRRSSQLSYIRVAAPV